LKTIYIAYNAIQCMNIISVSLETLCFINKNDYLLISINFIYVCAMIILKIILCKTKSRIMNKMIMNKIEFLIC